MTANNSISTADQNFHRLLASFSALNELEDELKREYSPPQSARALKIPISSYRKMFGAWVRQNQADQGKLSNNDGGQQ